MPGLESLLHYIAKLDPVLLEKNICYQNMPPFRETAIIEGYRLTLLRTYEQAKENELKKSYAQTA